MMGGAMYALERGLNAKWLGVIFAFLAALTSFGIGCGVQVNAIAKIVKTNIGIAPGSPASWWPPSPALLFFGGIKSIARVCEKLVPFMALFLCAGLYHHPRLQL